MSELANLSAAIFSPARIVYGGFLLLVSLSKMTIALDTFVWVSIVFLIIEIFHNDFLRIILNKWAERIDRRIERREDKKPPASH